MINSSYLNASDPNSMRNLGNYKNCEYNVSGLLNTLTPVKSKKFLTMSTTPVGRRRIIQEFSDRQIVTRD
jgi:hypothetical protein